MKKKAQALIRKKVYKYINNKFKHKLISHKEGFERRLQIIDKDMNRLCNLIFRRQYNLLKLPNSEEKCEGLIIL